MTPFLLATLLALAAGPLLYAAARRQASLLSFLDGFVMVSIAGLVGLEVVPGTFTAGGGWSLGFLALGLFGPTLLERGFKAVEREAHIATLALAIVGLVLHAVADGAVLVPGPDWGLPLSVVLHTLPVGMAVWWLLAPGFGPWPPALVLLTMGIGTLAGYRFGVSLNDLMGNQAWAWFQSLVAGSILHVVFGRPHLHVHNRGGHDEHEVADQAPSAPRFEGLGNVLAIGALVAIGAMHAGEAASGGMGDRFMALALESAPALLLAYVIGGFLYGELPAPILRWLSTGGRLGQALRGTALGLPLPVCSCSVLPLYQSLVRRGAPVAAALAFLIAAPEVGLTALFVSLPLLGFEMTLIRVGAAAALALLVGFAVARFAASAAMAPAQGHEHHCGDHEHPAPGGTRWQSALRAGFVDLVDGTAPWIVLGIAIAAAAEPFLTQMLWASWPDAAEVLLFALLGMPLYVCAAGVTPLIAVLLAAGVSPGAGLAFLLTGPATNIATFGVLRKLHGRTLALMFAVVAAAGAVALGLAVNLLPAPSLPALQTSAEHSSWWQQLSLLLLALLYAGSLLRRGARASLAELIY